MSVAKSRVKPLRSRRAQPQAGAQSDAQRDPALDATASGSAASEAGISIRTSSPRAPNGQFALGNTDALVAGAESVAFWKEQAAARQEIEDALIRDAGHSPETAPRALRLVVAAIAQAALVQSSAFERIVENGGPLTTRGRARRAYEVWQSASDRLHRGLQQVGLTRVLRAVDPRDEIEARVKALSPRSSRRRT